MATLIDTIAILNSVQTERGCGKRKQGKLFKTKTKSVKIYKSAKFFILKEKKFEVDIFQFFILVQTTSGGK